MKPKRCKEYIPEIGCIGTYGYPINDKCKGYQKNCRSYKTLIDKDVIKVETRKEKNSAKK